MKLRLYLLMLCLAPSLAYSYASALNDIKIIAELQMIYKQITETIEQIQQQKEIIHRMQQTIESAEQDMNTIRNTKLEALLHNPVRNKYRLNSLEQISNYLNQVKAQRQKSPANSKENAVYQRIEAQLTSLTQRHEILNLLDESVEDNLHTANTDVSERHSAQIMAQSLSIVAQIEIKREKRALAQEKTNAVSAEMEYKVVEMQSELGELIKRSGW